jgi:hypothetical protein
MFKVFGECKSSSEAMYILDSICSLIFHPDMLADEYERIKTDSASSTPVRDAFRYLMKLAGTQKPHISRIVLGRICAGWLDNRTTPTGSTAIPYRADILTLLLQKEELVEESGSHQSTYVPPADSAIVTIPNFTNETSITRSFILVFLSELPGVEKGLSTELLDKLLHPLMVDIMQRIKATGAVLMFGVSFEHRIHARFFPCLTIEILTLLLL